MVLDLDMGFGYETVRWSLCIARAVSGVVCALLSPAKFEIQNNGGETGSHAVQIHDNPRRRGPRPIDLNFDYVCLTLRTFSECPQDERN